MSNEWSHLKVLCRNKGEMGKFQFLYLLSGTNYYLYANTGDYERISSGFPEVFTKYTFKPITEVVFRSNTRDKSLILGNRLTNKRAPIVLQIYLVNYHRNYWITYNQLHVFLLNCFCSFLVDSFVFLQTVIPPI